MAIIVAHLPQVLPTSEKELHTLLSVLKATNVRIYDNQRVVEGGLPPSGSPDASRFVDKSQVSLGGVAKARF
jgi:hypothetical protein